MASKVKIFISYSHNDFVNRYGYKYSRAGFIVQEMAQDIRATDSRLFFKILRDRDNILQISDEIDERLNTALDECDIGVAFLSMSYCVSESCCDEFNRLLESKKPFFIVELENVWDSLDHLLTAEKARIDKLLRVSFWGRVEGEANPTLFGYPLPNEATKGRKEYYDALEQLVGGVKSRGVELLKERQEIGIFPEKPLTSPYAFLALPTPDVRDQANRLLMRLRKAGYTVYMPNEQADMAAADYAAVPEHVRKVIAECDLYLQLFGGTPGRAVPDADGTRLARLQCEAAMAARRPTLLWQSRSFDPGKADADYVAFLQRVAPHILSFEEFETFAEKEIARTFAMVAAGQKREARAAAAAEAAPPGDAGDAPAPPVIKSIAIDAAPEDAAFQQALSEALQNYVGVDNVDYEPDTEFLRNLALANDAVIFVWGGSKAGWNRTRAHLGLFRRFVGPDGVPPKKAIGDAAPPPPTAPPCPTGPDVSVVPVKDGVDPAALSAFLEKLGIPAAQRPSS